MTKGEGRVLKGTPPFLTLPVSFPTRQMKYSLLSICQGQSFGIHGKPEYRILMLDPDQYQLLHCTPLREQLCDKHAVSSFGQQSPEYDPGKLKFFSEAKHQQYVACHLGHLMYYEVINGVEPEMDRMQPIGSTYILLQNQIKMGTKPSTGYTTKACHQQTQQEGLASAAPVFQSIYCPQTHSLVIQELPPSNHPSSQLSLQQKHSFFVETSEGI